MPNIMSLGVSFKKLHLVKFGAFLLDTASKFTLFSLSGFEDEKLIKEQTYAKTENANFILEYFEYFYQMSSKSIRLILSYTVSKLTRFFETQCSYETY